MLKWIINVFSRRGCLKLAKSLVISDLLKVRLITEGDHKACEEIFRLNEPNGFPPGYFPDFAASLRSPENTFLVVEQLGQVLGVGGITVRREGLLDVAPLCYGMVHPEHHGRSIGTLLLLSRLSMLKNPARRWVAIMSCIPSSAPFYQRFGFKWYGSTPGSQGSNFDNLAIVFIKADHAVCSNTIKLHLASPLPTLCVT